MTAFSIVCYSRFDTREREIRFLRFQDYFTIISRSVAFEQAKVSKERKLFKQTRPGITITVYFIYSICLKFTPQSVKCSYNSICFCTSLSC